MTKSTEGEKPSSGFKPMLFFRETQEELSKVVWPDRQRLIGESAAVILIVSLSAALIYLVDQLFQWIAQSIF